MLNSLQEKLSISRVENFSLVLQNMKSSSHGKMSLLQEDESLAEVSTPGFVSDLDRGFSLQTQTFCSESFSPQCEK